MTPCPTTYTFRDTPKPWECNGIGNSATVPIENDEKFLGSRFRLGTQVRGASTRQGTSSAPGHLQPPTDTWQTPCTEDDTCNLTGFWDLQLEPSRRFETASIYASIYAVLVYTLLTPIGASPDGFQSISRPLSLGVRLANNAQPIAFCRTPYPELVGKKG